MYPKKKKEEKIVRTTKRSCHGKMGYNIFRTGEKAIGFSGGTTKKERRFLPILCWKRAVYAPGDTGLS